MTTYEENVFAALEGSAQVNQLALGELKEMLLGQDLDYDEMDRLYMLAVAGVIAPGVYLGLESSDKRLTFWESLQMTLYVFAKKKGIMYAESATAYALSQETLGNLAEQICTWLQVDATLPKMVVSLFLVIVVNMSIDAWCTCYYENNIKGNEEMEALLKTKLEEQ